MHNLHDVDESTFAGRVSNIIVEAVVVIHANIIDLHCNGQVKYSRKTCDVGTRVFTFGATSEAASAY
jgi:hypothetical protein